MERLLEILKNSNLDDYKVNEVKTISHQAFFIKQELDQHRIADTKHTMLTIYVDGENTRGSARKEIYAGESDEEIKQDIEDLKFNASLAMEPYFPLVKDVQYHEEEKQYDLLTSYESVIKAITSIQDTTSEKINSYEIFVKQEYVHMVNSQNVDISYNHLDEMVEIVINSIKDGHEVEVYHMIECGADQSVENIVKDINNVFKKANDRSHANASKKMNKMHVLLSGSDVKSFFEYFIERAHTATVYARASQVKIGDIIQKGDNCDKITLKIKESLPYSNNNIPFDEDGCKASDFTILDQGQYVAYTGNNKTAYYLGIKDIHPANNMVVEPGSKTIAQMKQESYLEIVDFSAFDIDAMTGDFGGEFRLAYYFDGQETKPVTLGSITCNMNNVLDHIYFSKETSQYNDCLVPTTVELFDINVAGE